VWLKRVLGSFYPELFSSPLTPKSQEIIERNFWDKTSNHDKKWYEEMLGKALKESHSAASSRNQKEGGLSL
jgi:hypothetical protein